MQPNSVNQPGTSAAPRSVGSPLPKEISRMPVQDFLGMANWQGAPAAALVTNSPQASPAALAEEINPSEVNRDERSHSPAPAESWLCLTVEQFFGRQNWQGLAQPTLPLPSPNLSSSLSSSPSPVETATVLPPVPAGDRKSVV